MTLTVNLGPNWAMRLNVAEGRVGLSNAKLLIHAFFTMAVGLGRVSIDSDVNAGGMVYVQIHEDREPGSDLWVLNACTFMAKSYLLVGTIDACLDALDALSKWEGNTEVVVDCREYLKGKGFVTK